MLKKIVGILPNGEETDIKSGYPSRGWCYASATKAAIDIAIGGNPLGLKQVALRYENGQPIPGYSDSDHNLQIQTVV